MSAVPAAPMIADERTASAGPMTDSALKAAFLKSRDAVRYSGVRVACWLVIVLMPAGASLDWFVYPEQRGFLFLLRVICTILAFGLWLILGTRFGRRRHRIFGMMLLGLPNLFMCLMIYFTEGAHSPYYAGLNIMLMGFSWVVQVGLTEAVAAIAITLLMYCAACLGHGGGTFADYYNNLYFIVLTGITAMTGGYLLNRLHYREFALRQELDANRRELEASNAKLVELDRAKSTFFANVSHELRTPLTLLIAPLERLRHRHAAHDARERVEMLDIMYNNAMRLLRLINDLLDLVRLDSGAIRVRREKVEIVPFLEGIAKSVAPMAQQRKLEFSTALGIEANAAVHVDRDKLEKIILNLLFNSFKFTPENGQVTLKARLGGDRLDRLAVAVRDTGKGIAKEDLPRIFKRFWQAEAAATRQYQGVGIGLALVKELAEAHGGGVSVESEVGKGTEIEITLDVSAAAEEEPQAPQAGEPAQTAPPPQPTEWLSELYRRAELFPAHVIGSGGETPGAVQDNPEGKPLVLVADDEPEMRRFLCSQLKENYAVREARNGSEALELAQKDDFELILLDLMMPGIDGITLTGLLRDEPRLASVPIIMLTARADEDSKMQALRAGVTDFLTKPFASSELSARSHNLLAQNQLKKSLFVKTGQLEAALRQIKDTESQLVQQAKMASLGQLSSGLMHEINNPLNFANTAAHLLAKRLGKLDIEDRDSLDLPLRDLQDGIRRVADIISGLRSFVHPDTSNFGPVPLKEAVDTAIRFVQLPPSEIGLAVSIPDDLKIWGNRNQLIHLFINLLQNAADSLREKGAPEKTIRIEAVLQNGRILLICEDNGKGIKTTEQGKVFDAFYTTKPVGSGMGLGLNICYRIVQNHRGGICVESREQEFCRFIITFHSSNPSPETSHHRE